MVLPDQRAIAVSTPAGGSLTLRRGVLTTIVVREVLDSPGVVHLGGPLHGSRFGRYVALFFGSLAWWLGLSWSRRGVRLDLGHGEIAVGLTLVARYGVDLPELAASLRDRVSLAVRAMTGLEVRGVDVVVAGLRTDPRLRRPARERVGEPLADPSPSSEPTPR